MKDSRISVKGSITGSSASSSGAGCRAAAAPAAASATIWCMSRAAGLPFRSNRASAFSRGEVLFGPSPLSVAGGDGGLSPSCSGLAGSGLDSRLAFAFFLPSPLRHPELKVSTPAHTKHLGWYLEFEFRVTHRVGDRLGSRLAWRAAASAAALALRSISSVASLTSLTEQTPPLLLGVQLTVGR